MFSSQIIIFVLASVISYINYKKNGRQHKFLKLYFIAMILSLITWVLNFLVASFLDWNKGVLTNVYLINIVIFLLFLYGVIKVTGGK
jgi:threonine/homoserine/homoserine lactone efflux protein